MTVLKKRSTVIFIICWTTYVVAYLCRVNMSSVLTKLEEAFGASKSILGFMGSLFFIIYAIGQLINGIIGDRVSPYKFLGLAVAGTATFNLIISLSDNFYVIVACWAVNGYFQSMFWGPLMRILSQHFSAEQHSNVSAGMTTSMVIGYILSWSVFGSVLLYAKWNMYFLIPSVFAFVILCVWIPLHLRNERVYTKNVPKIIGLKELLKLISDERLYIIVLICVCLGLVKESVTMWAPVILVKSLDFDAGISSLLLGIIPLANLVGIFFARHLSLKYRNVKVILLYLFINIAIGGTILFAFAEISNIVCFLMLALISAMTFGCNSIILSFIPLSYQKKNVVSALVGIFDFSSYVGAAISSYVLGVVLSSDGWRFIPGFWFGSAFVAILLLIISQGKKVFADSAR